MDESTLQSLEAALKAGPRNTALRAIVVKACLSLGALERARAHLGSREQYDADARRELAAAFLDASDAETCLALTTADEPKSLILRARAFLSLRRVDEARAAHEAAVAQDPSIAIPDFSNQWHDEVQAFRHPRASHSNVISFPRSNPSPDAARIAEPVDASVSFADVVGLEEVKRQIHRRIILPLQRPSLLRRFRKRVGGGVLMYGPPGCGKTLLARATAGECDALFINVAITEVLDMYLGESERKLTAIFERARSSKPTVVFFDELEALAARRNFSRNAELSQMVSTFLAQMDGFDQNNDGVLILAATNTPWAIDPAFRRPGRFDRSLFVPPPDRRARAAILALHLSNRPTEENIGVEKLAQRTPGFSGADLLSLVETATDEAVEASLEAGADVPITDAMLHRALTEISPTTADWLSTARNYARYADESGYYRDVLSFLKRHVR